MADPGKPGDFSTVIGADATFKGELAFESGVRVDGKLEGKIATKGKLHVSKEGKLKADVEAGSVSVEGTVEGNMTANDRIEVRESAKITGDLVAARLSVAEGAVMTGNLRIGTGAKGAAPPAAPPPRPGVAAGKHEPEAKR
jgi:cytoskeletal protein CcmA (bactofilin family)